MKRVSIATAYNQMNPFTPMFDKIPAYMAGHELIIENMMQAFDVAGSNPDLCSIFVGARGTGKPPCLLILAIVPNKWAGSLQARRLQMACSTTSNNEFVLPGAFNFGRFFQKACWCKYCLPWRYIVGKHRAVRELA